MKKTLLFIFCSIAAFAQDPIVGYYGTTSGTGDGINQRNGNIVTSAAPLDHSATGANITWNFTGLTNVTPSSYLIVTPTASEISDFPGTTKIAVNSVGNPPSESRVYFADNGTSVSYTGAGIMGVILEYTDPAEIGDFPMEFNYTNTDDIGGNFNYDGFSGTFDGTIATTVDAYGTLELTPGIPNNVTRVKIVQDLTLSLGFITVGTVEQTSYQYFRTGELFPLFSSVTTDINAPLADIVEVFTVMEAMNEAILATPAFTLESQVAIAPNPASEFLTIAFANGITGENIEITDVNGRRISRSPFSETVDISHLSKGIYFAKIETDRGPVTKKIIVE